MKASKSRIRQVSNNSSDDLKKTLNAKSMSKVGTESIINIQSNCLMTKSKNVSSDRESSSQGLVEEDEAFFTQSNEPNSKTSALKKKARTRNTINLSSAKISPRNALALNKNNSSKIESQKLSKKKNKKLHFMNLRQDSVFNHVDMGLNSYQIDENIKKANTLKEINESEKFQSS